MVKRVFRNIESTRSYEFFSISSKEIFKSPYKPAILETLKLQSFAILRLLIESLVFWKNLSVTKPPIDSPIIDLSTPIDSKIQNLPPIDSKIQNLPAYRFKLQNPKIFAARFARRRFIFNNKFFRRSRSLRIFFFPKKFSQSFLFNFCIRFS